VILFLTNNLDITKPLYLWLTKKEKVIIFQNRLNLKFLKTIKPDLIVSYNYKYIIPKEILKNFKIINLHISYLPYNRGAHPNIWSHLENTPKGVTIHFIDEGIDTGDIIVQKKVVLSENLTLKESYKKLHLHMQLLFKQNFNNFLKIRPKKQKKGIIHYIKDLKKINLPSYNITIKKLKELNENWKI
jgi:methionyl-tRNA formyltransferase